MTIFPIEFGTPEYDEAVRLRYQILREPLCLDYTPEQLAVEWNQHHIAAYGASGGLLGYMNLTPVDGTEVKMRQVAVAQTVQNQGVGRALVAYAEVFARRQGFEKMTLHARETAVPFYLKLGYAVVGERFEEVTLPHFKMEKRLAD